ncbi:MAG: PIN domain-containing protein [Deinococcales bacterium]
MSIVLLDACVLYPAPLRDLLMHLALVDSFQAKWTEAIHEEWIGNVLKNRPDLQRHQLERTKTLMNQHLRDCLVTGYEKHIPQLQLPDQQDRHVLAAAIHCHADILLTFNLKDFPDHLLKPYQIRTQHPDDFVSFLIARESTKVITAVQRLRAGLKNPTRTVQEILNTFKDQGLVNSSQSLEKWVDVL